MGSLIKLLNFYDEYYLIVIQGVGFYKGKWHLR